MGSTHTTFVESETRESVESQINQFKSHLSNHRMKEVKSSNAPSTITSQSRASRHADETEKGMFEADPSEPNADADDEDPYFNADEIAFKIRMHVHRDRKQMVKKLVKAGQIDAGDVEVESPLQRKLLRQ